MSFLTQSASKFGCPASGQRGMASTERTSIGARLQLSVVAPPRQPHGAVKYISKTLKRCFGFPPLGRKQVQYMILEMRRCNMMQSYNIICNNIYIHIPSCQFMAWILRNTRDTWAMGTCACERRR